MGTNKFRVIPKNHLSTVGYDAKSACSGWKFRLERGRCDSFTLQQEELLDLL